MDQQIFRCAAPDGREIAYATVGEGPPLVWTAWWVSHLELDWNDESFRRVFETLAERHTVIRYDRPGSGLSNRDRSDYSLAAEVAYCRAVIDDLGLESFDLFGTSCGGPAAVRIAMTEPERVSRLVLFGSYARGNDITSPETREALHALVLANWGLGSRTLTNVLLPGASSEQASQFSAGQRATATAEVAADLLELTFALDVADLLEAVETPTLVLHRHRDLTVPAELGEDLARRIPGAALIMLEGDAHVPWQGTTDVLLHSVEDFLTGERPAAPPERRLATVLVTDIVGSTELASKLGDARWRERLDSHDDIMRRQIEHHDGTLVKLMGDGAIATFDVPAQALRCARQARRGLRALDLHVRVGIHTGEIEDRDGDIAGVAVHIASRVESLAAPDEILVTRTVRDLVTGSDFRFGDRGEHPLRGVSDTWQLWTLAPQGSETTPATDDRAAPVAYELRRESGLWAATFGGVTAHVKHSKGIADLAVLLSRPQTDIHVLDLASEARDDRVRLGADAVLDDRALTEYKDRLVSLDADLAEVEANNDIARVARLATERDALLDELRAATGIGGRARALGDETERARKAVSARIRSSVGSISDVHPELGSHLRDTIRTGTYCGYFPSNDVAWRVQDSDGSR